MLLEIDVGNTRLKWRIRDDQLILGRGFIVTAAKLEELEPVLQSYRKLIKAVWVASVVGDEYEEKLRGWAAHFFSIKPIFAKSCAVVGAVKSGYSNPALLGVDRWLSILAAYNLSKQACIILSLGTASTIDVVDKFGNHLGGFIAPGLRLMAESLDSGARGLSIDDMNLELSEELGFSTSSAICGGCTSMLIGLVDNAIKQLRNVSGDESFALLFAGGDVSRLKPFYPQAQLMNSLVLDGLVYAIQGSTPLE
jgi:type III pantothenate kinase